MLGKLQQQEIEELLGSQLIGRIGCHANNTTYVVPISYAYDGNSIYCHAEDGMKLAIMRKNPQVCFEVDQFRDMANWQSVIAWGTYEEITDKQLRREALKKLVDRKLPVISSQLTHLSPQWPFLPNDINEIDGVVFRIHLREKTGRFENNNGTKSPGEATFMLSEKA